MEQLPSCCMVISDLRLITDAIPGFIIPVMVKYLTDTNNQVLPHFMPRPLSSPPENIRKPFLMFSGGIERAQWHEMGWWSCGEIIEANSNCLFKSDFSVVILNFLISGGNKRSYILEKTCSFKLQLYWSTYKLLLPSSCKGLCKLPNLHLTSEMNLNEMNRVIFYMISVLPSFE